MNNRRVWWLGFWAGAIIVAAAVTWVSLVLLELEQRETAARADARHQESLRLALWRMDSWFAPRLARESARPYFEYLAFYPQERAYTRILNEIEKGDVLTPSPLLAFRSEYFPIYFQISPDGGLASPQVPLQNQRDLAEATLVSGTLIDEQAARLADLAAMITWQALSSGIGDEETRFASLACGVVAPAPVPQVEQTVAQRLTQSGETQWQQERSQQEFSKRAQSYSNAQKAEAPTQQKLDDSLNRANVAAKDAKGQFPVPPQADATGQVTIGPLVPLWINRPAAAMQIGSSRELVFVRRVHAGDQECLQGFLVDWPHLRDAMLAEIKGLADPASLVPDLDAPAGSQLTGRELASIPVTLIAGAAPLETPRGITPARLTLLITWLAVIGAVVAAGFSLRASVNYGDKRSRFASAVTHELRTPLTTFRMYSEMLAEGMVPDPSQRQAYLETLKSESGRLATLVENVLTYARLEDGRAVRNQRQTTAGEMLDRMADVLNRRATDAGMTLRITHDPGVETQPLSVDVDAVSQILFNLVDNACKYARDSNDRIIELHSSVRDGSLCLTVRDQGPGVAAEHVRKIFAPFDRGAHGPGDTIPGVGLGLALSRGLARDLGGDLQLCKSDHQAGACFELTLPLQSTA